MKLRTRLLLGYGYLALLVLVVAGVSTVGFFRLSKGIRSVLEENFASVRSAIEMQRALERQDSILLQRLVRESAAESLEKHDELFRQSLERAEKNVTIEGERAVVEEIAASYATLAAERQKLLSSGEPTFQSYDATVYPAFEKTQTAVLELMELNYQAMIRADEVALDRAARFGLWMGALVVVALASLIFIARGLQEYVVRRLDSMARTARAVGAGEPHRRFVATHEDELGDVALLLNEALDEAEELRNRSSGAQSEGRRLCAALFEAQADAPAALLDAGRNVVARVGPTEEVDRLLESSDGVAEQPLVFGGRTIGWLVGRAPR